MNPPYWLMNPPYWLMNPLTERCRVHYIIYLRFLFLCFLTCGGMHNAFTTGIILVLTK
jgi:hypothetical protein